MYCMITFEASVLPAPDWSERVLYAVTGTEQIESVRAW